MPKMSNALVALGYRSRRSGKKVAGYVASVYWRDGDQLDVRRVKITFDREKAFPFPKRIALAVAQQYRSACGGYAVFLCEVK